MESTLATLLIYCTQILSGDNREGKVDGFRHSEVSGQETVHVPEDERMNENIDGKHNVDVCHRELVVFVHRLQ